MAEIFLVTGGARSGKSQFAEDFALKLSEGRAAYIATAIVYDEEMAQRVKIHQARRNNSWTTFEAPFNADKTITEVAKNFKVILFDCVTIYLSNYISTQYLSDIDALYKNCAAQVDKLITAAKNSTAKVIFVSNEVGGGIVPENKLARIFRDIAGFTNQKIAAQSEKVFMTVAGCPVDVKQLGEKI